MASFVTSPFAILVKNVVKMFESPGKAQFLMKRHTKHRKDTKYQAL